MLSWHKRTPHDNKGYFDTIHQKEIEWRDKTYSSELKDIKVSLFPDRLEIEKLNIMIPFSSLNNFNRQVLIRRIIAETATLTSLEERL
jgi:hypothetical protein